MKISIRGFGFLLLMSSIVLIAMAAQPGIIITAPNSDGTEINGTFGFVAQISNTDENVNVIFNFSNGTWYNAHDLNSGVSSSGNFFYYSLNTNTLADGAYSLEVTATNENTTLPNSSSATRTFSINNAPPDTNEAPVANAQSVTTTEDTAKSITLTGSDADLDTLTFATTNPSHGTLSGFDSATGAVTYTPDLNYNGPDSFTFTVNDGLVTSSPASVSITVTSVNDAPVANGQSVTTDENTAKSITLTGTDVEGNTLTFATTNPSHGTLSGFDSGTGAVTYTPASNYNGPDSFTFTVNDGSVTSAPATVSITVTSVNEAPVANAQSVITAEDTAKGITLTGTDADGDALTFAISSNPSHGTLSGFNSATGAVTYTPDSKYNGPDSFTFTVNDGSVTSDPATVSVTVNAVNDAPVATAQSVTTAEDTAKGITLAGTDADGDTLTYAISANPSHGSLSGLNSATGAVTYTPASNYNGADSFSFTVNDGSLTSPSATVSITVNTVNDAPVASAQSVTTAEDTAKGITLAGTDVDGDTLTYAISANPSHGSLSGFKKNTGAVTYTPDPNYNGADSFSFTVNDGSVTSDPATVSITVGSANDAPIATAQSVTTAEDTAKGITLAGTDADGDTLTYAISANPSHGSLSGLNSATGAVTYTPASNYNGADSFTFTVNDGSVTSATATVSITVNAANDAPAASAQSVTTAEDTAKGITLTGSDPDGDTLTYAISANPSHGSLSGLNSATGAVTYTPDSNYNGADSFTFTVNDGSVTSATATVSITVNSANDAPTASAQAVTTTEDTAKGITLTGSDADGDTLTYAISANPSHGSLSGLNSATGAVTYTPAPNYDGADSFSFTVNDGSLTSATATVSITVNAVNDAPMANAQSVVTDEDTAKSITLTGTDADGDALTYAISANPSHGSLSGLNGATGAVTYTPAPNYNGADSFTFTVNDGSLTSATATVSITVNAVNDAPVANNDAYATNEDTVLNVAAPGVLINDTDPEGGSLSAVIEGNPSNGTLTLNANGSFSYTPNTNFNGVDSFTYRAKDPGNAESNPATIRITVYPVNDAPVANAQSVITAEDTAKGITLTGTDVDGNTLTFAISANPSHGSLSGLNSATGAVTYTPAPNYNGPDSFTFTVNDGSVTSPPATVSITVNAVNDAPVANAQSVVTDEDIAKSITLTGSDADLDTLIFAISANPLHGTLSGFNSTTGVVTYTPASNYNGPDSFTFTVNDGSVTSAPATVNITVNAVNDAPVLSGINDSYSLIEGETLHIVASYTDAEGDPVTFTDNSNEWDIVPSSGVVSWKTVDGNQGDYVWQIKVTDSNGAFISKNFTVHVGDSTPGMPINLSNTINNFWVNYSWEKGANTDSFNVSYQIKFKNGSSSTTWTNDSATFINRSIGPHGWGNITVYGYNNTLKTLNLTGRTQNTQIPNTPIKLVNVSDNYSLAEGQILVIFVNATDDDGDTGTFDKNFNYSIYDSIYNSTYKECIEYTYGICSDYIFGVPWMNSKNILMWKTLEGYDGNQANFTFNWTISVADGYGSISIKNIAITVHDSTPGTPTNLASTTGNFWVNHTWTGINSNTFNVSGVIGWVNGSSTPFIENSYSATSINKTVGPHGWSNITVYGWNNSLRAQSPPSIVFRKQLPDNLPSVPAKSYPINWPNLSNGTVTLTWNQSVDADGDYIDYQWQLSNKSDFSIILKSNTTGNLHSEELNLTPGIYYWRVKAKDYSNFAGFKYFWGESAWNQSSTPDFQIVAAPAISNIKAYVINDSAVRIEWTTDQMDAMNKVEYSIFPKLNSSSSSWNNNTNNPSFVIAGLIEKSVFYQVSSYNSSNMTAYSNSSIFNAYPLKFSINFIEPAIKDNNLIWTTKGNMWGHVGKYIGVDGKFENLGPDPLNLSITETYNNESNEYTTNKIGNKTILLGPNEKLPYNELFGRPKFVINSSGVIDCYGGIKKCFTFNLNLNITAQKGDTSYTFYNNNAVISLPLYPISKIIKSVTDKNGLEIGMVLVKEGYTSTIYYTLEANSSVNLSNVSISYPADQGYFNISTLEANVPVNKTYTYPATTSDLNKYKCEGGYPCIINNVTFSGKESGNQFSDTEYVVLPLCSDIVNCIPTEEARPKVTTSPSDSHDDSRSTSTSPGGGGPGGGGGGGGGGVASGEDFNNIERREAREKDVTANAATVYVFKSADPVMVVAFESSVSENGVPVLVEVLKNRSKFIDVDAPGKLYKYFNVYAGMSGFSAKIKSGVIAYRVNNTWLEENGVNARDITLYKWEEGWVEKNTEIAEQKENYTYFASSVGNFTKFAIGVKRPGASLASIPDLPVDEMVLNTTRALASNYSTEQSVESMKLPGAGFSIVLVIIFIIYYMKRNGNR